MQTLSIKVNTLVPFSTTGDVNLLASLDMGVATIPECAIDHKNLNLSWFDHLPLLLHLPVVRINEISTDSSRLLHLCALHPDLLARKLTVAIGTEHKHNVDHSLTYAEDFGTLLKMPTLQEVTVCVQRWCGNLMKALTKGFRQRACLSLPLRKISLRPNGQSIRLVVDSDIRPLWDAIFSLPEIEQLDLTVGDGFLDFDAIYESWLETVPLKHQLKSITIATKKQRRGVPQIVLKEDILSHLTQNYYVNPKDLNIFGMMIGSSFSHFGSVFFNDFTSKWDL